ncbi:MAG: dTMP kinase [Treponema sp.]|nr:dTMP kinase [Treponema sp.]
MILKNFVVFEGIDGAGTSTQIKMLAERNPERFVQTAEPTGGETGLFLRRMLAGDFSVDEKTNAFLFAADRCEHIYGKGGVKELTESGKTVLSDRYLFSSLAYQSISCGEEIPRLVNSAFPLPEILFYFQINPQVSLSRVNARGEKKEIYEKIELQQKIAAQYEKIISSYEKPENNGGMKIIRIDAAKSIKEISEEIYTYFC